MGKSLSKYGLQVLSSTGTSIVSVSASWVLLSIVERMDSVRRLFALLSCSRGAPRADPTAIRPQGPRAALPLPRIKT